MTAIVSLANDVGNYQRALSRLGESLIGRTTAKFLAFRSESEVGAPSHKENPYAFKVYAIEAAYREGFRQILWLDSSVYAIKNVQPAFDLMTDKGYLMQDAGWFVGQWCNDETLKYFGITREQAMQMRMYGNAGMLGIDFRTLIGKEFFYRWKKAMTAGLFKGSWDNHRHDMTCGSIIANILEMEYQPDNSLLQYASPEDPVINESIIFKAQGI